MTQGLKINTTLKDTSTPFSYLDLIVYLFLNCSSKILHQMVLQSNSIKPAHLEKSKLRADFFPNFYTKYIKKCVDLENNQQEWKIFVIKHDKQWSGPLNSAQKQTEEEEVSLETNRYKEATTLCSECVVCVCVLYADRSLLLKCSWSYTSATTLRPPNQRWLSA